MCDIRCKARRRGNPDYVMVNKLLAVVARHCEWYICPSIYTMSAPSAPRTLELLLLHYSFYLSYTNTETIQETHNSLRGYNSRHGRLQLNSFCISLAYSPDNGIADQIWTEELLFANVPPLRSAHIITISGGVTIMSATSLWKHMIYYG